MNYLNKDENFRLIIVNGFLVFIFIVFIWVLRGIFFRPFYIFYNYIGKKIGLKTKYDVVSPNATVF